MVVKASREMRFCKMFTISRDLCHHNIAAMSDSCDRIGGEHLDSVEFPSLSESSFVSMQTEIEEKWSTLTHGFGFALSLIGFVMLVDRALVFGTLAHLSCFVVYGVSLALGFGSSTLFHASRSQLWRMRFRALDHICIYFLIAGSFTPIAVLVIKAPIAMIVLTLMWTMALVGTVLKIFFTGRYNVLSTIAYLVMGWLPVLTIQPLMLALQDQKMGLVWIALGGFFYTFGVLFYVWNRLHFNHVIWHLFVLGGAGSHFVGIMLCIGA